MGLYNRIIKKSLWVFHVSASPCNNCDIEILDLLTPKYDVERFGIRLVGSVRHADVLLITGIVSRKISSRVKRLYEQAPRPVFVVAVGACPAAGSTFKDSYTKAGPADNIIPVDLFIPGCPPKPEEMINGIIKLTEQLK
ncbi:MAG: NADH-quinone oxidoreductase subunit B family protein [Bacillota bacterium]